MEDWRDIQFIPDFIKRTGAWVMCYTVKGGRMTMRWTEDKDASKPIPHWESHRTRSVDLDDPPTYWLRG